VHSRSKFWKSEKEDTSGVRYHNAVVAESQTSERISHFVLNRLWYRKGASWQKVYIRERAGVGDTWGKKGVEGLKLLTWKFSRKLFLLFQSLCGACFLS